MSMQIFCGTHHDEYRFWIWWINHPGSANAFLAGFSPCRWAGRPFHPHSCRACALVAAFLAISAPARHEGKVFSGDTTRVDASTEGRQTDLAAKRLDALGPPMAANSHQSMDLRIGDSVVLAPTIWASKALSHHALGRSAPTLDLPPWSDSPRRKFLT